MWNESTAPSEVPMQSHRRLSLLLLAVGMAGGVNAQTRILVGPGGGSGLGNSNLGIATSVEVPFGSKRCMDGHKSRRAVMTDRPSMDDKMRVDLSSNGLDPLAAMPICPSMQRFELDASNVYSPLFSHPSAGGSGYTDQAKVGGIVWASLKIGITGSMEYSAYKTISVHKWGGYQMIGPIFRLKLLDVPTRLDLQYIREFHNGVYGGIESNRIQGVRIGVSGRVGCTGAVCWRLSEAFVFARGLNQGNSACDGTGPANPMLAWCPRSSFIGGSVQVVLQMEWPRRRGGEDEVF